MTTPLTCSNTVPDMKMPPGSAICSSLAAMLTALPPARPCCRTTERYWRVGSKLILAISLPTARSLPLLALTTFGMILTWLLPPALALFGRGAAFWCSLAAWVILSACYLPTLTRFDQPPLWAPFLPLVAAFYMAATIGSAANHYLGRGVAWKGRAYQDTVR